MEPPFGAQLHKSEPTFARRESAHRRACLRVIGGRPHVSYDEATYVLAGIPPLGPSRGRASAALQPPPRDAKDEERLATLSKWQEAWDRSTKARWTHRLIPNIRTWIERRHGELNYHLTQLLTGQGFFQHHSQRYDHNQSAQCPVLPHIHRERGACILPLPEVQRRERERDYMPYCTRLLYEQRRTVCIVRHAEATRPDSTFYALSGGSTHLFLHWTFVLRMPLSVNPQVAKSKDNGEEHRGHDDLSGLRQHEESPVPGGGAQLRVPRHLLAWAGRCLAYAEPRSLEYVSGLQARANLHYHVGNWNECLLDAREALDQMKRYKLTDRLGTVKRLGELLAKAEAKSIEPRPEPHPSMINYVPLDLENQKPPNEGCLFDGVEPAYNEVWGRHLVATRDIKVGEMILVEDMACCVLTEEKIHTNCSHCAAQAWCGVACDQCVYALYCSQECKAQAWSDYHEIECQIFEENCFASVFWTSRAALGTSLWYYNLLDRAGNDEDAETLRKAGIVDEYADAEESLDNDDESDDAVLSVVLGRLKPNDVDEGSYDGWMWAIRKIFKKLQRIFRVNSHWVRVRERELRNNRN
ncbi:unnamed protein product [Trichogramma brassicae]|uniref:MYND-type domain-containing protein n=1 Tax=Trichogramma brassicae TaxID=86971 RepID=A0A6H5IEJ2_9HYME|nr:unnamed protein product [Trichogramma brassicae]